MKSAEWTLKEWTYYNLFHLSFSFIHILSIPFKPCHIAFFIFFFAICKRHTDQHEKAAKDENDRQKQNKTKQKSPKQQQQQHKITTEINICSWMKKWSLRFTLTTSDSVKLIFFLFLHFVFMFFFLSEHCMCESSC